MSYDEHADAYDPTDPKHPGWREAWEARADYERKRRRENRPVESDPGDEQ